MLYNLLLLCTGSSVKMRQITMSCLFEVRTNYFLTLRILVAQFCTYSCSQVAIHQRCWFAKVKTAAYNFQSTQNKSSIVLFDFFCLKNEHFWSLINACQSMFIAISRTYQINTNVESCNLEDHTVSYPPFVEEQTTPMCEIIVIREFLLFLSSTA